MSSKEPHYAVQFALRYGAPTAAYLSTWVALTRIDELIEDAKNLKNHFDAAMPQEERWAPWVGAEIVSYYVVGFVTCLEWHARSRLVDLLTFKPTAAKSEDLRVVKDKVVLEMLAANVTVAAIVGAATRITSLEDYLNVFSRLFSAFDIPADGYKAINAARPDTGSPWVEKHEIEELRRLYSFRNNLVHEIGIERIGHFIIRDRWDPEEAIRAGELTQRVMQALEASISANAPPNFPNILAPDGFPTSERDHLEKELSFLEKRIARITTAFTDQEVESDEDWRDAKAAAADYLAKEMRFLENSTMLFNRYVELREPLKLSLIKSRHAYLKSIIDTMGDFWDLDELPESAPSEA